MLGITNITTSKKYTDKQTKLRRANCLAQKHTTLPTFIAVDPTTTLSLMATRLMEEGKVLANQRPLNKKYFGREKLTTSTKYTRQVHSIHNFVQVSKLTISIVTKLHQADDVDLSIPMHTPHQQHLCEGLRNKQPRKSRFRLLATPNLTCKVRKNSQQSFNLSLQYSVKETILLQPYSV
jgi:hypothetical protein